MKISYCDDSAFEVGHCSRTWLVEHSLVAVAGCTGLTCVDSRNNEDLILYFFLKFTKTCDIINNAVLAVSGTWSDNKEEFI